MFLTIGTSVLIVLWHVMVTICPTYYIKAVVCSHVYCFNQLRQSTVHNNWMTLTTWFNCVLIGWYIIGCFSFMTCIKDPLMYWYSIVLYFEYNDTTDCKLRFIICNLIWSCMIHYIIKPDKSFPILNFLHLILCF